MQCLKNILLTDRHGRPIATDVFFLETGTPKPVLIYAHGFNGFKDWGHFDLIAGRFAAAGFVFVKFNFSFNGTTPGHPEEFVDLEAYARNNYTIELDNLNAVISWVSGAENPCAAEIDSSRIGLIGHSMGGGIVLLQAGTDSRVKAAATWAAVCELKTPWGSWPQQRIEEWRETGVQYIANSRTRQEMPLYYQLYEDYQQHAERLDIRAAAECLRVPLLICHGTADPAVPLSAALQLHRWQPSSSLFTLDTDHVFGRRHPWPGSDLPEATEQVVSRTISFFQECFSVTQP